MLPSDGQMQSPGGSFCLQQVTPTQVVLPPKGIGVLSPSTKLPLNRATSVNSTLHLKQMILQEHQFKSEDHSKCMDNGRMDGQKAKQISMQA
eukprot:166200-Ditylum_brightwellii.AAC.1